MHTPETETKPRLLATRNGCGYVYRCDHGCLHICIGDVSLRLAPDRYWNFMEMLSEASQALGSETKREQPKNWRFEPFIQ